VTFVKVVSAGGCTWLSGIGIGRSADTDPEDPPHVMETPARARSGGKHPRRGGSVKAVVDEQAVIDGTLRTSRSPDDLPARCERIVQEFAVAPHSAGTGGRP
jgi:putative intracellular protease/amidase